MINVLSTSRRRHAIKLADRLLQSETLDPSLLAHASQTQIHHARAEMVLRAGQCVAEVDRRHRQMISDAQDFVRLTKDYIASHPLALADLPENPTNSRGN